MAAIEVSCSQCGSGEYRLVDERTGEVVCQYCRNQWVVPELARKSETEKFLEQQAQQPRVIYDNTAETDRQLMGAVSGIAGILSGRFLAGLRRILRMVLLIAVIVLLIIIAIFVYRIYF
ncbi:MAG: hypothetical protein LBH56_00085 [Coriobacteriales bacterium]|jgi:uncharacterized Zn finger protein (UPF0148 family)|nr:hypothetical protein [Coriobacteriales bacterium]